MRVGFLLFWIMEMLKNSKAPGSQGPHHIVTGPRTLVPPVGTGLPEREGAPGHHMRTVALANQDLLWEHGI